MGAERHLQKNNYVGERSVTDKVSLSSVPEFVSIAATFVFVLIGSDARQQSKAVQECELQMEVSDMVMASQSLGDFAGFWSAPPRRLNSRSSFTSRASTSDRLSFLSQEDTTRSGNAWEQNATNAKSSSVILRNSRVSSGSMRSILPSTASVNMNDVAEMDIKDIADVDSEFSDMTLSPSESLQSRKSSKKVGQRSSLRISRISSRNSTSSRSSMSSAGTPFARMSSNATENIRGGPDYGIYCITDEAEKTVTRIRLVTVQDFEDPIPSANMNSAVAISSTCYVYLVDSRVDIASVALPSLERAFDEMRFLYSQKSRGVGSKMPPLRLVLLTHWPEAKGCVPSDETMEDLDELVPFMKRLAELQKGSVFTHWHLTVDFSDTVSMYECLQNIASDMYNSFESTSDNDFIKKPTKDGMSEKKGRCCTIC